MDRSKRMNKAAYCAGCFTTYRHRLCFSHRVRRRKGREASEEKVKADGNAMKRLALHLSRI